METERVLGSTLIPVGVDDLGLFTAVGLSGPCVILQILGQKYYMTDALALLVGRSLMDVAQKLLTGSLQMPTEADADPPPPSSTIN